MLLAMEEGEGEEERNGERIFLFFYIFFGFLILWEEKELVERKLNIKRGEKRNEKKRKEKKGIGGHV